VSRGVQFPVVLAFRVTHEEAAEIDAACKAFWQGSGYGSYPKGMRASFLHKLVLAALRGDERVLAKARGATEDLPVNAAQDLPVNSDRGKHGSSGVNADPARKRPAGPRGFLKKAFPKKKRGS
jgi:hypothetical protein